VRLWTGVRLGVRVGDAVRIVLPVLDSDASLPATVIAVEDESLRAQFDALSLHEDEALTMVLYSRADTWLGWDEQRERDRPLRSLGRLLKLAGRGLRQALLPGRRGSGDSGLLTGIAPLLLLGAVLFSAAPARGAVATAAAQGGAAAQASAVVQARAVAQAKAVAQANSGGSLAWAGELYRTQLQPAWMRGSALAAQYPWALMVLVVLQTFLIAVLLRAMLRRRARERLLGHI
jgi:hypothetical protein